MLEVHAILHKQRCYENMTEKTGTLSDAYEGYAYFGAKRLVACFVEGVTATVSESVDCGAS